MRWSLIFADEYGCSVQVFVVSGHDPEAEARKVWSECEGLRYHSLIAAVEGEPNIRVRNSAHDTLALE